MRQKQKNKVYSRQIQALCSISGSSKPVKMWGYRATSEHFPGIDFFVRHPARVDEDGDLLVNTDAWFVREMTTDSFIAGTENEPLTGTAEEAFFIAIGWLLRDSYTAEDIREFLKIKNKHSLKYYDKGIKLV